MTIIEIVTVFAIIFVGAFIWLFHMVLMALKGLVYAHNEMINILTERVNLLAREIEILKNKSA